MVLEIPSEATRLSNDEFEIYWNARTGGTSHRLAMVLATRRFPGVNRRDERWRLTGRHGKYQPALAEYPGDPRAFCSSMQDAHRRADELGVTISDRPQNSERPMQDEPLPENLGDLGRHLGGA